MSERIIAQIPFDHLINTAEVTGEALKHGQNGQEDSLVLSFQDMEVADLRIALKGKDYDWVKITCLKF